jgi:transcriptional regulator with XRE-family HTH domain
MSEEDADPGVHRRKLRSTLRQLREACGKTQSATAEEMSWSVSKVIRIESGSVNVSVNDLRALLQYYGASDQETVQNLVKVAKLARGRSWLSGYRDVASEEYLSYLGYEEIAVRSHNFQPVLVPGLLQTEEYALTVMRTIRGPKIPSRLEKLVDLRVSRQEKVFARTNSNQIDLYFLLDESVLRRPIGGADVMRKQLQQIETISQRDNVWLGIIPFAAGFYRSIRVPFVVLEFSQPEDQAVLYLEYPQKEQVVREDVPAIDSEAGSGPAPPTYLEVFAELQQFTSPQQTSRILQSALADLGAEVQPSERESES